MSDEAAVSEAPAAVDSGLSGEGHATATPVVTPEVIPSGAPTDVAIYQDVVAKFDADNSYDMTAAESKAYLSVSDRINGGQMETPEGKLLKEEAPPSAESKPGEQPETTPEAKVEAPPETDRVIPTDAEAETLMEAMKKVGAKDVTELPGKIADLIKNRDTSGSKLGSENAAMKIRLSEGDKKAANHQQWLNDLAAGKPEAIKYLNEIQGGKTTPATVTPDSKFHEDLDDYLDPELAGHVRSQDNKIEAQAKQIQELLSRDKQRDTDVQQSKATTGWIDDVVGLVTSPENAKDYGLTATEARGLAEKYWGSEQKNNPIDPRFQKVHELIMYAYEQNLPSLESAHILMQHKTGAYAKQIVDATKKGQQTFTPSQNAEMSEQQSRKGNNVPQPEITEDGVNKMIGGDLDSIPDDWSDDTGTLIPANIPQRFHERIFGKTGKPK